MTYISSLLAYARLPTKFGGLSLCFEACVVISFSVVVVVGLRNKMFNMKQLFGGS